MAAPTTRHFTQLLTLTAPAAPPPPPAAGTFSRVPLDLSIEITDANGTTYRWAANQKAANRLTDFSFATKLGEGFSDSTGQLARRIDLDYPDLELLNDVKVTGADGTTAYEGRISATPRELGDSHSIGVQVAGYMAHAKDRPFREIYVDREIAGWTQPSLGRRIGLVNANFQVHDSDQSRDPTDGEAGVTTGWQDDWPTGFIPISEAWYDAGPGLTVSKIVYRWKRMGGVVGPGVDTTWQWLILSASDDQTDVHNSGDLQANGPAALTAWLFPTPQRYAVLQLTYPTAPAGSDGAEYGVAWFKLAAYGDNTITTYTGEPGEPEGVRASDVITNIVRRFCPLLNTDGVVATNYIIQHLAFKELTDPYDAFLQINKYHLWHLGVWDDRTLHFRPHDLSDHMWEIRTDDPGTTFSPQGPSIDGLWNGIVVTYNDLLTGTKRILDPDNNPVDLSDTNLENPWNKMGVPHWDKIELSTPTLEPQALQIGRAALASSNRPKAPGTITVRGYIKDRAGHDQPVWRVRAGDTIAITNFPNAAPRLIHETRYDDETKTVAISVDAPAAGLDAVLDRQASGVAARNLSG